MARKIIPIGGNEIERYKRHRIAKIRITEENLSYGGGYLIGVFLEPQPTRAWLNRHPSCIELIVAGDKFKNASERSIEVD